MESGLHWLAQQGNVWSHVLQFLQPRELCLLNCLSKDRCLVHDDDVAWHVAYVRTFNPFCAWWAEHARRVCVPPRNKAAFVTTLNAMKKELAAIKQDVEEEAARYTYRELSGVREFRRAPVRAENAIVRLWRGLWSSR